MIPKIRHLIWLGGNLAERHVAWLASWREQMPDWEVRFWDDASVAALPVVTTRMWNTANSVAERADLLRYWVLHEFGGVYADTDVQCLKSLDPLLEAKKVACFIGEEKPGRLCNAVIGAEPGHAFIALLNERIERNWFQHDHILNRSANFFVMRTLAEFKGPGSVNVFPPRYFYPYVWDQKDRYAGADFATVFPLAYLVHHWESSWRK
jgi:inositol phosphorylceramide mannosyltransferase catalytic subunit